MERGERGGGWCGVAMMFGARENERKSNRKSKACGDEAAFAFLFRSPSHNKKKGRLFSFLFFSFFSFFLPFRSNIL